VRAHLRKLHDALARGTAAVVGGAPWLERPFLAAGRLARACAPAQVFYGREASDLSRRWQARGTSHRPVLIAGQRLRLDVAEFYAHDHFFNATPFEPGLAAFVGGWLRPGDTFVDAGANHGFFSLLAATLVGPQGHVYAFEPHPEARERLERHLIENGLASRVAVSPFALSDRTGTATMHQSHHTALASLVPAHSPVRHQVAFGNPFEVGITTFDAWRAGQRPGHIRLMKIDVEGAEALVLQGMTEGLRAGLDAIVVETARDSDADRQLREAGYSVRTLDAYADGPENRLYSRSSLTM
jgi:FkbM family methyltransferase